ncbi:hypothetical protein OS190_08695 [Sulfitobacter sp. F26204]|uniref:hypothetical protein n=1 Tax=Sulfitobacter sp. F26204 TaxID=2996014 RepID=UPI00225DE126|nr:hypothetical protein [Sulfitobacter sp. F26204]MCX7559646.1 hypothetical protein [Sulfitobacter sp. F26204]
MTVRAIAVPQDALLQKYAKGDEAYTDCFAVTSRVEADLPAFIEAFYTTWLFRLERFVLMLALRRRIRDRDVVALATGEAERFAVWTVEAGDAAQILLRESSGATRSYLAVRLDEAGRTRLLFGSAVVTRQGAEMSSLVRILMPLHLLYSRALLSLAERRLRRG